MPIDLQAIIKILKMLHLKNNTNLNMSHEEIVNIAIYNRGVLDVLNTLEGIDNGNIDTKEYLKNT